MESVVKTDGLIIINYYKTNKFLGFGDFMSLFSLDLCFVTVFRVPVSLREDVTIGSHFKNGGS